MARTNWWLRADNENAGFNVEHDKPGCFGEEFFENKWGFIKKFAHSGVTTPHITMIPVHCIQWCVIKPQVAATIRD